jgi:hypothetical protein
LTDHEDEIKIMEPDDSRASLPEKKKKCPFIRSPDDDCYFLDMNSNKISMVLFYCQNHYTQCTLYKSMKIKKSTDKDEKI